MAGKYNQRCWVSVVGQGPAWVLLALSCPMHRDTVQHVAWGPGHCMPE